jgi:hypothetical protein
MSWRDRTPEVAVLAVLALLVVVGVLASGGSSDDGSSGGADATSAATVAPERIARISRRVERLRGLRFRRPVVVEVVTPAEARRVGMAELRRAEPRAEQRAAEELLKLIGLLPAETSMRRITSLVYAEQVAGFYDPRSRQLALVRGAGVDDVTLAHELTHALEDQHFDLERFGDGPGDDRATAEQALVEGTATLVMTEYAARWPSETPVGDALTGLTQVTGSTPLPAYVMRMLIFPYIQGESFASALYEAAGGDWQLLDVALRDRPPVTTAEILDPDRWLQAEQPAPVALDGAAETLRAAGYHRLDGSTLGAEDVAALLSESRGLTTSRELTAGWRGGRYALWRRGPLDDPACPAPCRRRDALVLAVRVEEAGRAQALAVALRLWAKDLPPGSASAARVRGTEVRAALAPTAALARRLAG